MSSKCPCCKQLVPYGHNCDYPVMGLINEFGGITSEAKHKEEIEQARKETRQQCADICFNADKSTHPTDLGEIILNAGKQDKGEGV